MSSLTFHCTDRRFNALRSFLTSSLSSTRARAASIRRVTADASSPNASANSLFVSPRTNFDRPSLARAEISEQRLAVYESGLIEANISPIPAELKALRTFDHLLPYGIQ